VPSRSGGQRGTIPRAILSPAARPIRRAPTIHLPNRSLNARNFLPRAGDFSYCAGSFGYRAPDFGYRVGGLVYRVGDLVYRAGDLVQRARRLVQRARRLVQRARRLVQRAGRLVQRARRLVQRAGRLVQRAGRLVQRARRLVQRAGRGRYRAARRCLRFRNFDARARLSPVADRVLDVGIDHEPCQQDDAQKGGGGPQPDRRCGLRRRRGIRCWRCPSRPGKALPAGQVLWPVDRSCQAHETFRLTTRPGLLQLIADEISRVDFGHVQSLPVGVQDVELALGSRRWSSR
jgi:hypothetical protein